jgi:16S rRNA processing protein RimM
MNKDELFQLGKVVRTFGSKGEVVFQLTSEILTQIKKLESVFLNLNENLVPFFIEQMQSRPKNQLLVKLMDVDSDADATLLAGSEIYIPLAILPKSKQRQLSSSDVDGFLVIDSKLGETGTVLAVIDMPQQSLLSIGFNGKEILVPVVEEIIKKIDRKNKTIYIEAPEGLIDLYIS